jgi:hypothetical protein
LSIYFYHSLIIHKKRMYRTRFELIRDNPGSKRKINDSSYGGKVSRSTFFSRVEGMVLRSQYQEIL